MGKSENSQSDGLVTIKIDGIEYRVREGQNLIRAAASVGVYIPHYCFHPSLPIDGSCRLCLVEIAGRPKLEASCNMVATDGLEIFVNSEAAKNSREGMMEFLLVNHPLDCPVCDQGGECHLQRYAMDYGLGGARTIDRRRRYPKPDFDPLIDIERNRCILCTRCTRFCDHVAGEHIMGIFERGDRNYIGTYKDGPVSNLLSGNVVDLCPVGTLTSKSFRFRARPWELFQTQTTCVFCSVGCRVTTWMRGGKVYRTTTLTRMGSVNFVIDEDTTRFICNQGRYGSDFAHHPERFFRAAIKEETTREASADDAVAAVAEGLRRVVEDHGPEAVGLIVGPRATNEEMWLARRLARDVIGTSRVDARGRLAGAKACREHARAFGRSRGTLEDVARYDSVIVLNGALFEEAPIAAMWIRDAARDGDIRLGMAGWRHDAYLAGMAHASEAFGPQELEARAKKAASGEGDLGALVKESKRGLVVFCPGEANGAWAGALNRAAATLTAAGGDGWETLAIDGARNMVGAYTLGVTCEGGVAEILRDTAQKKIKALLVVGADDFNGPTEPEVTRQALEAAEFVAVIDTFASSASDRADVVLPGLVFFEQSGTYCDLHGQMACLTPAQEPSEECRAGIEWLTRLANALGAGWEEATPDAVFERLMSEIEPPNCPLVMEAFESAAPGSECPTRCSYHPERGHRLVRGKWESNTPSHVPVCDVRGPAREVEGEPDARIDVPPGEGLLLTGSRHVSGNDHCGDRSEMQPVLRPKPTVAVSAGEADRLGLEDKGRATLRVNGQAVEVVARVAPMADGVAWAAPNLMPEGVWSGAPARCELKAIEAVETA